MNLFLRCYAASGLPENADSEMRLREYAERRDSEAVSPRGLIRIAEATHIASAEVSEGVAGRRAKGSGIIIIIHIHMKRQAILFFLSIDRFIIRLILGENGARNRAVSFCSLLDLVQHVLASCVHFLVGGFVIFIFGLYVSVS